MRYRYLLMLLMMFAFVGAVKPLTQINTGAEGLQIFYPDYSYIPQETNFRLNVHVSNISNGVQFPNTNISCYVHLYNSTGHHTLESLVLDKDVGGLDHELDIISSNFSDVGEHAFYIWCNQSGLGGSVRGIFMVTPSGEEPLVSQSIVYGIILFITLILFIGSLLWFKSLEWGHYKNDEGTIVQVSEDRIMKIVMFFCSYISLLFLFFIGKVMVEGMMITNNTTTVINALFIILLVGLAPITLAIVVLAIITTIADSKLQEGILRNF